ncbi:MULTISPECIES: SagB/ThcOx family dehydrogenase [Pseudomonas]|uniref:SagB/ThcOx family dehydrogenase n=1 Tax=Pseudomonas TaxID=286 RepID=UPI002362FB35|nr:MULTISPECIES: SagB/ThcOx family dehydrogenase [Pseudomonas]WJV26255.1 SagB/ThcOx family dehydrogenase [Pseudomonas chlororaphis]
MTTLFSNPSLYILQTKLVAPNTQGNSRWTVVNPVSSTLYGAMGKDEYPKLIKILKEASSCEGALLHGMDVLTDKELLLSDPGSSSTKKSDRFLDYYHEFVHGYVFHNYDSVERFEKDREQMNEYGKIASPPDVYTQRASELPRFSLPSPKMELRTIDSEMQLLSNILSGAFLAVGQIDGGDFGPWLRKASPSGGARHPIEALVIINGIEGIPDGVYYFDPPGHQLIYKKAYCHTPNERRLSLVISARVERPMWRYRESRSFRAIFLDAGHCIETLHQLSAAYGGSLTEELITQDLFSELDLQDIPLCGFSINKRAARIEHAVTLQAIKADATHESKKVNSSTHYTTNPFLWCYFTQGTLIGVTSFPAEAKILLDDAMFRVLNYAQASKRGDRPSTPADISLSQDVPIKLVDNLIRSGLLLERETVRNLYGEAAHWIAHGWYQNLLVYLEYRSKKFNSESFIGHTFFHQVECAEPNHLWQALSKERKTTRKFSTALVDHDRALAVMTPCLNLLNDCDALQLFHLKRTDENLFDMETWNKQDRCFVSLKQIASSLLEDAVIGQRPVTQASDIYWFTASIEGLNSVDYVNTLLRLGMLMQKVCISCAHMKLGLFITPASNDLAAAKLSALDSTVTINYFAAVGHPMRT